MALSLNENAKKSGKRGVNWKGSEVRALLAVWEEEVNRRGAKDSCTKNAASEIFEAIAQKLRMEHDVNKTGVQVQLKCKTLRQKYTKVFHLNYTGKLNL